MNPRPTGHVSGNNLNLTRTFRAPIDDVWTIITRSESTARWIGPWKGEAAPGKTIQLNMVFESADHWSDMLIEVCEPPRHLIVTGQGPHGARLEATLHQRGELTELVFVHHAVKPGTAGDYGPGWEYYLDNLVASRDGTPLPTFTDYYPSQKAYYVEAERKASGDEPAPPSP